MAISKFKKPVLAKFAQGITVGNSETAKFSDWTVIYYIRNSLSGSFVRDVYGIDENFDLTLTFENNSITKQIVENTVFLIDEYPTNLNTEGNYRVRRIVCHDNNQIIVGLEKLKATKYKNLYYADSGNVYSYQINYDSDTMKAYTDKYAVVPFEQGSILWLYEPDDVDDIENRIQVTSVTTTGIVESLQVFNEYTFEEYSG